jgi:hypothetical protein
MRGAVSPPHAAREHSAIDSCGEAKREAIELFSKGLTNISPMAASSFIEDFGVAVDNLAEDARREYADASFSYASTSAA